MHTTLAKLGKAKPVSMDVILRICAVLNCNISDVMNFIPIHISKDTDE